MTENRKGGMTMAIELVRIDDRLIHGQVVVTWSNNLSIEQIIIVDDNVANDEILKAGIQMTAPTNISVKVFAVNRFIELIQTTPIKKRTMIILTGVKDALALYKGGLTFEMLNVGGIRGKEESIRFTNAVALKADEIEMLKELMNNGVDIQLQMIPADTKYLFKDLLKEKV